jgi:glucokinase
VILAIDIGGTKMSAGYLDTDGRLLDVAKIPTPQSPESGVVWGALDDLLGSLPTPPAALLACGVGCGGPMAPKGETVSPLNIPGWRAFPLLERLTERTGLATYIDNDAKAFALAEGWLGAAVGSDNFLGMVVSTGVGGGIVLDGRLLDGRRSNAGHIGHVVVEPDGRPCACGGFGCLEAEASGTAIAKMIDGPPAGAPPDIVARTGTLVGRAIASVANLLDLSLVVIAGSVALGFGEPFFDAARAEVARHARLDFSRDTRVLPAGLGESGPLIGAGAVALHASQMLRFTS